MNKKIWALVLSSTFSSQVGLSAPRPATSNKVNLGTNFSSSSTSLTVTSDAVSLSKENGSLTYIVDRQNPILIFTTAKYGKLVQAFIKSDDKGITLKVGIITRELETKYSKNNCTEESPSEKLQRQLKEINSFVVDTDEQDLSNTFDKSCESLNTQGKLNLRVRIEKQFQPQNSYLIACLNSKKALEKIEKFPALKNQIPMVLDSYFMDLNKQKENVATFKINCEKVAPDKKFNAKYLEKEKAIVFPVKDNDIATNPCLNAEASFTHEYMHHSGMGNEKDVQILEAICAEANGLESYSKSECSDAFAMKECLAKDPATCNQAGISAALQDAARDTSKKDRAAMTPALKEGLKDVKLENVAVSPVQNSSQNNQAVAANQAPANNAQASTGSSRSNTQVASSSPTPSTTESRTPASEPVEVSGSSYSGSSSSSFSASRSSGGGGYDSSMRAIGAAMQRNMNKISSVVDKAYEATVSPAVAAEVSGPNETSASSSSSSSTRAASSGSKSKVEEYVVEEIIADKYGVPVEQVRAIQRQDQPSVAGTESTRLGKAEVSPSAPVAAATASSGGQATGAGASGNTFGYTGSNVTAAAKPAAAKGSRNIASVETTTIPNKKELMGIEYNQIREKYDDLNFIRSIANENVRIEIPKEKRKIGSQNKDATIYVDTGRSLMRKR